jgi:membrane protein
MAEEKKARFTQRLENYFKVGIWQVNEPPGIKGLPTKLVRIGTMIYEGFVRHSLFRLSAALALVTLLAAIPLSMVVVGFVHWTGGLEAFIDAVWPSTDVSTPFGMGLRGELEAFSYTGGLGSSWILSLIMLVVLVLMLLMMLERGLNRMWGVRRVRSVVIRIPVYGMLGFAGLLFIGFSFFAGLLLYTDSMASLIRPESLLSSWFVLIPVPMLLAVIAFSIVFFFLPNTIIRGPAAITGGVVGGIIWEGFRHIFMASMASASSIPFVPGVMILGLLAIVWLYMGWLTMLAGGQLVYAIQHMKTHRRELDLPPASVEMKERVALRATLMVCRAFAQGEEGPTLEEVSSELGVPLRLASQVVYQMTSAGLLRELARSEKRGAGLAPAKDPAQITVRSVVEAVRQHGSAKVEFPIDSEGDELDEALSRARNRAEGALDRVNFKNLVATKSTSNAKSKAAKASG